MPRRTLDVIDCAREPIEHPQNRIVRALNVRRPALGPIDWAQQVTRRPFEPIEPRLDETRRTLDAIGDARGSIEYSQNRIVRTLDVMRRALGPIDWAQEVTRRPLEVIDCGQDVINRLRGVIG